MNPDEAKDLPTFSKDCLNGKLILITRCLGATGCMVVSQLPEVHGTVAVNDIVENEKGVQAIQETGWPHVVVRSLQLESKRAAQDTAAVRPRWLRRRRFLDNFFERRSVYNAKLHEV